MKFSTAGKGHGKPDIGLGAALNINLFDIPPLSAVHQLPRNGLFRSYVIRLLWGIWARRLSSGGRFFFLATGLFFGYGATSLEMQAFVPLAYSMVVWALAFIALILERPVVSLAARHVSRIAAGESIVVDVEVQQTGQISNGGLHVLPNRLPLQIEVTPRNGAILPPLATGQSAKAQFTLRPQSRGIFRLSGYRVQTDFPFGLLYSSSTFWNEEQLTVYPRFTPLDRLELPMGRRYQPGGVAFASPRGESMEYIGNRDYREGDDVRHIDWRSTARLSRPIVREYREEYFLRAAVILDTHLDRTDKVACEDFERAVSLCAACGDYMNRSDYLVDILAAGPNLYHLVGGLGLASLDQMLDILACVEPSKAPPWETLEPEIRQNLEQITSVICLFLDWDEERRAFAHRMSESGAAVKVVVVREGKTALDPHDSAQGDVTMVDNQAWQRGVVHL